MLTVHAWFPKFFMINLALLSILLYQLLRLAPIKMLIFFIFMKPCDWFWWRNSRWGEIRCRSDRKHGSESPWDEFTAALISQTQGQLPQKQQTVDRRQKRRACPYQHSSHRKGTLKVAVSARWHHALDHLPKWIRRLVRMTKKVRAPSSIGLSCSESNTAFWCWEAMVKRSTTLNLPKRRTITISAWRHIRDAEKCRNGSLPLKNTRDKIVRIKPWRANLQNRVEEIFYV